MYEEMKPVTIHETESDHQTGSTDDLQTEGDKCQLSYAQILAQGLYSKQLQPSSQAINMSVNRNDRTQSPRPTSPMTSYSREWSASPSRDISSTVREEVTKSVVAADRINTPTLERRSVKKKIDNKVKKEVDGVMHVHSTPSGDQQKHKSGKNKQKKKETLHTNFECNGKREPINDNREQVLVNETEVTAVANIGEPLTGTSGTRSVADNSLASVKDRKGGYNKSKLSDIIEQQNMHSKPVSQISPQSSEPMEMEKDDASEKIPEKVEITNDKESALLDQERKKRQKKKKMGKNISEDEIEKALKEIAMMEMTCSKHKNKNNELAQEVMGEVTKPDKEDKKYKKLKSAAHADNANALIHEAEPKEMATLVSSSVTSTAIQNSNSQGNITELEEQDKIPEILTGVANERENVNVDIPKIEDLKKKKKKKRGKKLVGCSDDKHPVGESKMLSSYRKCEIDGNQTGQDVLFTQKLEPFAEKQHEAIDTENLVEAEPVVVEQGVSEHFQEEIVRAADESAGTPQFVHVDIASEEAYISPPDLLADIELGRELLRTNKFVSGVNSDIPANVGCEQKETDHSVMKKNIKGDVSSPVLNKGKRGIKKQNKVAKLPREEVNKNDGTSVMVEKSHTTIKSVPLEEQLISESKSHLASSVMNDNTENFQKDEIHEPTKKTNGPDSPIKGKRSRKAAKKGTTKQDEAPHCPKQEPAGTSVTSDLYRHGARDDLGSDNDISGTEPTDVTDLSSKKIYLSTELNEIEDRDAGKSDRMSRKCRKGKQPKTEHKPKLMIEKQNSFEKHERNEHNEKNDKQVLQELSDKFVELATGIPEPLDVTVEGIMGPSGLGVSSADIDVVEVMSDDLKMKGKSKKPYKSKSTAVKAIKKQNEGRDNTTQNQAVNLLHTGVKTGSTDSDKGKRNFKKSKKEKAVACEQNKCTLSFEHAAVETNENERPEARDFISNTDNISSFVPLEHSVAKSSKSKKKSKKHEGSEDKKDEELSTNMNVVSNVPDMSVIKTKEDLSLCDTKREPQDKISEHFKEPISFISNDTGEKDTRQFIKWVAESESVQAQTAITLLPEEVKTHEEAVAMLEEDTVAEDAFVHGMSLPEHKVFGSYQESLHEEEKEVLMSSPGQVDEILESIRDDAVCKSEPKRKDPKNDNADEDFSNQEQDDICFVSAQENLVHRIGKIQGEGAKVHSSPEKNISVDALSKQYDDKMKVRHTTNVQTVDLQVNIPQKTGHEAEGICSVLSLSSPESKEQNLGASLVAQETLEVTESVDTVVLTSQCMTKSTVNVSSEDSFNLKQPDICDLPDHSVSDISHVEQATNQNHGNDLPLIQSSVPLLHPEAVLPLSPNSVSSNCGLTQGISSMQEENIHIELHGANHGGIFGSVKERRRKPRKIIDTLTVDEKVAESIDVSTPNTQEKKKKPPKSPAKYDTKKADGKVKMAEEPKDLEEHEEYRAMKDKMKKKKRRPKIPIEFTSPQTKEENDIEAVKVNLSVETAKKHQSDDIVQSESEIVPLVTDADPFHLQNITKSDIKSESNLASAYFQPLLPETVMIEEQTQRETPYVIDDSILPNSKIPLLLEATPKRIVKENLDTPLRLSNYRSTEINLDMQESQSDVPEAAAKSRTSCVMKSDEFSDAWMSALDEPLVFDGDDDEYGNIIVTSPSVRSIGTDDALIKIQEAVIAAVESIYDRSESALKAGTVTITTNDMVSETGLKSRTIPTLEIDVDSDSGLKTETMNDAIPESGLKTEAVTALGKDMLSELDVKTEITPAVANDVLSEAETIQTVAGDMIPECGLITDVIPVIVNDVLSKPEMKSETVTDVADDVLSKTYLMTEIVPTVVSDVISESGLKVEGVPTVLNDVLPEHSLKTETVSEVVNDVLSETCLTTETNIEVVEKVVYEPELETDTVTEIVNGVISDPDMKTETANYMLSEPCLMTEAATALLSDVLSGPGVNSETVSAVVIDMTHELGLKMETAKDVVSESNEVTETVTTISNDLISLPDLMSETVVNGAVSESDMTTQRSIRVSSDEICEEGLMSETGTAVENDVVSEPGLMTEAVAAVANDDIPEPDLLTEKVTTISNNVISETGKLFEIVTTGANDVPEPDLLTKKSTTVAILAISEPSLLTETTTTTTSNGVICEPGLLTETVAVTENNVIPECCLLTETVATDSDNVISEPGKLTETVAPVANDDVPEPGLLTETAAADTNDMISKPSVLIETVAAISNNVISDPGKSTEPDATVVNEDIPEPDPLTETLTTVANYVICEPSLLTETAGTVTNDVIFEPGLLIETVATISIDVIPECGLMTETLTTVANDVNSEPGPSAESVTTDENCVISETGLLTETTTAVAEVKSFVQTSDSLLDIPDVISPLSEELADTCPDALEEAVVSECDGQVSVEGIYSGTRIPEAALQNSSLSSEELLKDIKIPVAEFAARGICHNPFTAQLIVRELKPSYYLYRDAEIYWQEKVAQEMKKAPFALPKIQEKQGVKRSSEKLLENKELPVTRTEQHKLEAPFDESGRNRHVSEVPIYDIHTLLDSERRWHEFKTLELPRDQEAVSEKPESTVCHSNKEVIESTQEQYIKTQVINPDGPLQSVKETVLPETLHNISKNVESTLIHENNPVLDTSKPQVPSSQNIAEVMNFDEEHCTGVLYSTLDIQGSAELMEDRNTQVNNLETHETQLKLNEGAGSSSVPKEKKTELISNLCKENMWPESFKFHDAEREWRVFHSKLLTTEQKYEEDGAGIGTVDVLKSPESVRGEGIASEELLRQQQIEVTDVKIDTNDIVKLQESADINPSSQDASQELEIKSILELPEDSKDDNPSSQVMSQDQALRAVSSELIKESADYISPSQDVSQESKPKSSSEMPKDEIQFVPHQEQLENELENCSQDYTKIKQKEANIQRVPEGCNAQSVYCYYDVVGLCDVERQHQENLARSEPAETETDTSTNVKSLVENNLENLDAEVQNCKNKEEVVVHTEPADGTVRTWAAVAAYKKSDSLHAASYEEESLEIADLNENAVSKLSDLQKHSQPSVHVCIAEVEKEESDIPVVEVDPEGFMKFVPKKERRKRKSRSRSRSCCRDDVTSEKPQQVATVTDIQTREDVRTKEDYSMKEHTMRSVMFESSEEISVCHAVDTGSKGMDNDVELYTSGEDKSSFIMIQRKSGKEVQEPAKKSERVEGEKGRKRKQRSGKSAAHQVPCDSGRKKPLSEFVQGVEGIGHYSNEKVFQHCLSLDGAFWPDKWQCHDAECQWQETVAQCQKPVPTSASTQVISNERRDRRDDSDGGNSGHSSPGPHTPKGGGGSGGLGPSGVQTEQLSADLPGGICSWPGESTYLSAPDTLVIYPNEQKRNEDEALLAAEEECTSRLAHKVAEEVITDLDDEQESECLFYSPSSATQEAQPSCRKDDTTAIFMVQMKVGDLRNPLFSMCYCCVCLRA
jgi:hypothetical protein